MLNQFFTSRLTRLTVTRRVPSVEQELLTFPVLSGVHVVQYLVFCVVFCRSFFFCLSLFWPLYCLCFDPFAFLYFGHCIVSASILLSFFILAIALSVLRSFILSLFWPLYCLCIDPFAFLYFGHCIVCVSILLPFSILVIILSVLRSFCLSLFWPLQCLCFDPFAFL